MKKFEDVKKALEKVLKIIHKNRSKFKPIVINPRNLINAEKLEQAAGNHFFDDNYKDIGITEKEGHIIRTYFFISGYERGKDYIIDLHKHFPEFIDDEDPKYLKEVNKERRRQNLEPIVL